MPAKLSRVLAFCTALASAGSGVTAHAGFWFDPCCCCPPIRPQVCYRTVPVTEYREVRQTVQRPEFYTDYEDRPVTEYRQVVETRTAEIPTVSFQTVTEYQTVQRDCGRWVVHYHQRPKLHPCQYDGRPDLFGAINRAAYTLRMAFTPDFYAQRTYQPNVVTQQVPIQRQVAVRGTQTVTYQVPRVVTVTSTRRVAVNKVRMVAQEIVARQPVTVFKTVPIGPAYAFGAPAATPAPATALQPTPDADLGTRTAIRPKETRRAPSAEKPAARSPLDDDADDIRSPAGGTRGPRTNRDESSSRGPGPLDVEPRVGAREAPTSMGDQPRVERAVGRWVARKKRLAPVGPELPPVTLADATSGTPVP